MSPPGSPKTLLTPALDRLAFYFPHSGWRRAFCGGGPTWGRPHSGGFGGGLVVAADRMASVAFILNGLPVRAGATQRACAYAKRGYVVFFSLDEQKISRVRATVLAIGKITTRAAPGDAGAHVETRPVRQPSRRKQGIRRSDARNLGAVQGIVPWRRAHPPMAPEEAARRLGCARGCCARHHREIDPPWLARCIATR